jgi:hypothetical protein
VLTKNYFAMITFPLFRSYIGVLVCSLLFVVGMSAHAVGPMAARDAELRAAVVSLRTTSANEAARNATMAYFAQLSRQFPADPYVQVQLANVYGLQAHYAKTRDAKSVWAAKADGVLDEVISANPHYLLAQATRGVQMVMVPQMLGLETRGEQLLKQVISSTAHRESADDDEAVIISYVFLSRLYERQATILSGDAQAAKKRDAEQMRIDVKKRFPNFDLTQAKFDN